MSLEPPRGWTKSRGIPRNLRKRVAKPSTIQRQIGIARVKGFGDVVVFCERKRGAAFREDGVVLATGSGRMNEGRWMKIALAPT